jgi:hypothetical protein
MKIVFCFAKYLFVFQHGNTCVIQRDRGLQ